MVNGTRVEEEASMSRQSWDDTDMVIPIESRATDDRADSVLLIRRLSTKSKVHTHMHTTGKVRTRTTAAAEKEPIVLPYVQFQTEVCF